MRKILCHLSYARKFKLCFFGYIIALLFTGLIYAGNNYQFDPKSPYHSLYVPEGKGPFPAILLLHASTGVVPINHDWAHLLRNHGYVVYIIDSFKPRGWKDRVSVGWEIATNAQLSDATPAYRYLSKLPYVDPLRIGVLGFSMGGFDVLRMREAVPIVPSDFHKLFFKVAVSFYGVCHRLSPNARLKRGTSIFIGTDDDRATTNDCKELVVKSNDADVSIRTYKDGLHGFDNFEFPKSKEIIDEKGEHYHIGYNQKARKQAIFDLMKYLDAKLK